ncbi:MAG: phospholipase A [Betaproteobacteria bacterium]|nr:phospholipase A [Betaproteobacteria bacterium]MCL2887569.1 phospholipase A [Betaproteobacteria bacterium]
MTIGHPTSVFPICLLAVGLVSASAAQAETLAVCRAVADDAARLSCYDRLAGGEEAAPIAPLSAAPAEPLASSEQPAANEPIAVTALGKAWELDPGERGHILRARAYKPVYVLPWFHARRPNTQPDSPALGRSSPALDNLSANEAKFQISFKSKLAEDLFGDNGDLWFGYTQSSHWQVYSGNASRPFRETNYEPEAMLLWRTDYPLLGWRGRFVSLGINHQSNGQGLPLSRSWNRVILTAAFERDDWALILRPWWRIPEGSDDDNPDISSYLGRADVQLLRRWGNHQLSLLLRHNLRGGSGSRGALQIDYAFPIAGELRGHLQWFSGYGESMIDYNHRNTSYGIGVSLIEW